MNHCNNGITVMIEHDIDRHIEMIQNQSRYLFTPDFAEWLRENFAVWKMFEAKANAVWNRGRRHYSARTIIEVMRHESVISDSDATFKLNNVVAPNLARLYLVKYRDRSDFFEVRTQEGSARAEAA